jgi:hypothetical protein
VPVLLNAVAGILAGALVLFVVSGGRRIIRFWKVAKLS